MAKDPVYKKEVDEKAALGGKARFLGKVFYFCSKTCRAAFQRFHHPRSNFHVSNSLLGLWVLIFSQNPAFADRYNADN